MAEKRERDWQAPPAPGELSDGRYVIPSPDDHYTPWVVEAVRPRKRDFWKVLFGRWRATVTVTQTLTVKGVNRELKFIYHGPTIAEAFHQASPLLEILGPVEGSAEVPIRTRKPGA
jgi:hypothetical protein